MNKTLLMTALILGVSGFALKSYAADDAVEFATKAAISSKFEIDSSKLALEKSTDKDVKLFAQKMIDDHTGATADLKAALKSGNVTIPGDVTLDKKHQDMMDELNAEKSEDFDDEYLDAQEEAHEDAVKLFKHYAEKGENSSLKSFAAKTLPTLESHHEHVEKLDDTVEAKERAEVKADIKADIKNVKDKTTSVVEDLKNDAKVKIDDVTK